MRSLPYTQLAHLRTRTIRPHLHGTVLIRTEFLTCLLRHPYNRFSRAGFIGESELVAKAGLVDWQRVHQTRGTGAAPRVFCFPG